MAVSYLFFRFRFNWSEVEFGLFSSYAMITQSVGTSFSIGVFSNYLKLNDFVIGVFSSISKILSGFVYAFAVTDWEVYMGLIYFIFFTFVFI